MSKSEKIIVEWVNLHIIQIAAGFVMIAAAWMRMAGRGYVGNDFHFSLYDIPGNCNSLPYRMLAGFFMRDPDSAVFHLKYIAYAGDFAVAFLALRLLCRKPLKERTLHAFFVLTACLLSPVALLYSVGGMEIDSLCMSLVLAGILLFRKALPSPGALCLALAALLYPAYWPVGAGLLLYMVRKERGAGKPNVRTALAVSLFAGCLLLSLSLERQEGYFWGKLFLSDPAADGARYRSFGEWLLAMGRIYGYFAAMGSLLLAIRYRKLRVPALAAQLLVIMYIGWQQTSFLAI